MAKPALFQSLYNSKLTGQVIYLRHVDDPNPWVFHVYMGQLLYVHGGPHSMRRWLRHVSAACPQLTNLNAEIAIALQSAGLPAFSIHWQYQLLSHWVNQGKITREHVRQVLVGLLQEVLFDLLQAESVLPPRLQASASLPARLVALGFEDYIAKADRHWQTWQAANLQHISPNLAPVIQQPEALQEAAGNVGSIPLSRKQGNG